jgi:hypothetical protein
MGIHNHIGATPQERSLPVKIDPSDKCSRCGECCKWICIPAPTNPKLNSPFLEEFLEIRGIKSAVIDGRNAYLIPSPCPHLYLKCIPTPGWPEGNKDGWIYECDIYETRSVICRNENIQQHRYIPPGCTDGD